MQPYFLHAEKKFCEIVYTYTCNATRKTFKQKTETSIFVDTHLQKLSPLCGVMQLAPFLQGLGWQDNPVKININVYIQTNSYVKNIHRYD